MAWPSVDGFGEEVRVVEVAALFDRLRQNSGRAGVVVEVAIVGGGDGMSAHC